MPTEQKVKVFGGIEREKTALSRCINCVVSNRFSDLQQSNVLVLLHTNQDHHPLVPLEDLPDCLGQVNLAAGQVRFT